MKHWQSRRDECTHQISAKLTAEAFEIYKEWRHNRRGGREISNAILSHSRHQATMKRERAENAEELQERRSENIQQRNEILSMQKNIKALQKWITKFSSERDAIASEMSEMFCPQRPE